MQNITSEQIESLIQLQSNDKEIQKLEASLDAFPLKIADMEAQMKSYEKEVAAAESEIESKRKAYRDLESRVKENSSKMQKSNAKLPSVKTNKEYQALLKEIDDLKKINSNIEDEMLLYLDSYEAEEDAFARKKAEFSVLKEQIRGEIAELSEKQKIAEAQLATLKAAHEKLENDVDAKLLKTYHTIQSQGHKTVICEAKSAVCQGCHVNIPPQLYNELQKGELYIFCHNCQRMVYYAGK